MMNLNLNSINQSQGSYLADARLRTRIRAELEDIRQSLEESEDHDEITESIRSWYVQFNLAILSSADEQRILRGFIELLQEILLDPISHGPLDDQSYLGSDGRTYSHMSLMLYLNSVQPIYRNRSPLDLDNPTLFTFSPHLVVRKMILWLRNHHAEVHFPHIEEAYRQLPIKQTSLTRRVHQIQQIQFQRNQQRHLQTQRISSDVLHLIEEMNEIVQPLFEQVGREIEENTRRDRTQIEAIQENDQQQSINFEQIIQRIENDIEALESQNHDLQLRIRRMDGEINLVAIANGKLEVALNDAKAALKKKRKSWYKDLSKTLVVIGACAFATFAAQGLMLAMGSTANLSAIPLSGGASLKLTIPIL